VVVAAAAAAAAKKKKNIENLRLWKEYGKHKEHLFLKLGSF
jgi:hypothetical protein